MTKRTVAGPHKVKAVEPIRVTLPTGSGTPRSGVSAGASLTRSTAAAIVGRDARSWGVRIHPRTYVGRVAA